MKVDGRLFLWGALFYGVVAVIYGVWTGLFDDGEIDWIGVTVLVFTTVMALMVGFFMSFTAKRLDPQPEDDPDADIADADADYGFFSPHSWWPLMLAGSIAIIAFGWVFAAWIVALGVASLLFSLWGFTFEYYRGPHAH